MRHLISNHALRLGLVAAATLALTACSDAAEPPAISSDDSSTDDESNTEHTPGTETSEDDGGTLSGEACEASERVGAFNLDLAEDYTSFRGAVADATNPNAVFEEVAKSSSCRLLQAPNLFCASGCQAGTEICAGDDLCVPSPLKGSAGEISVSGLKQELNVSPNGITLDYSQTFTDPYPGFEPGAAIVLNAPGDVFEAFTLRGEGVQALTSELDTAQVQSGSATELSWQAAETSGANTEMAILLTVNAHGGTGAWIECVAPDTGHFEIDEPLVTQLIELGLSGFPRVTLSRRTVDSTQIAEGCVELSVTSSLTLSVEVPGLVSCSDDDDCDAGQFCQAELVCGEE